MSAKKCCCCGLLSCFPCFAPITNPSRPAATHTVVESSHQLSSSAPPSAVAASQVKASRDRTVMQNAPSVPVPPSCSQGSHVASSAPVAQAASSSSRLPKESDHAKSIMESAKAVQTVMEAAQTITPITNPSLAATHTVVQSSHQLSSYAPPPSAVASSQVNASTDGTVTSSAPSVPVLPSCSQGTVTSSAPSVPVPPSCSQGTVTSFDPSVPVLPHVASSAPPSQPASSSTPPSSSSRLPGESDHAKTVIESAKAVDKENVDGDLSDLINYISELFRFIEEKEQGNNPSMPKLATDYWPGSKTLLRLRKVLSEGINVYKNVCPDAKTIAQDFLRGMGSAHMATTGLLAVANILERYEKISDNKKACLSLLKEMNKLAGHVKELQKLHELKKGMEASMRETTVLIVEASMACCTQIDSTKFSGFFSTIVDGVMLAEFQKQLTETYTLMQREYINQINMRRQKRGQLLYPQYPEDSVGIEDSLKEVIERLEMGSDKNAVAVILHGFGGMGKTTLADAVFARLLNARIEGYKYSYVRLFDDITSVPDVVKLQRCILTDLMMREESEIPEIRRYEEGQRVIEHMLEKEAAFIYIDNVLLPDRVEQGRDALRQLLPRNMGKARKLRLLLTARDNDAVRISGVKPEFYPIKSLPHEEALDLFKKTLDDDVEKQLDGSKLNEVVEICGGVPNLLKVVAGFISSEGNAQQAYSTVLAENKINWKGEIGKDMECYMFAYENLEETLKDIFLDLCFFFQGWDWEALSNIVGEAELKMLEKRSLVTKDVKSMTARVHDVILAIGLHRKGERFRFTRASEFRKFLDKKEDKDLEKIKGIWSSDDSHLPHIPASKLDLMHRSLRVVILGNSTVVEGKCKEIFEELVIFRARVSDLPLDVSKLKEFKKLSHLCCKSEDLENLSEMPSKIRHIDFELKSTAFQISSSCIQQLSNLRVLRLRDAQLKILPQELGELGNDLQELVLSNCEYLEELPVAISTLGSLKVLRIGSCSGLTQLPKDFGSLNSLQELHLRECGSLEALPSSLGNLTSLQELHLNWCVSLEALPDSVEELSSLRLLDLSSCESIKNLPYGLEKLTSLVELSLRFCSELSSIPESIGQVKLLDSLDLSYTKVNELPDGFCSLYFITKLKMDGCRHLEKLPDRFGEVTSLRKLSLVDCNSLKKLPESFSQLKYLELLDLSCCRTLKELCMDFKGLSSLRVLSLDSCEMLKLPEDFHYLTSLEVLSLRYWNMLEGKWMDRMINMKTLQIVDITRSALLEGRWGEIRRQYYQPTLSVYTGQVNVCSTCPPPSLGNMHRVATVEKREPTLDKPQELLQTSQPKSSEQKINGFVVIQEKNVLDLSDYISSIGDHVSEMFDRGVSFQLVSASKIDSSNGIGKLSKSALLQNWISNPQGLVAGHTKYGIEFDWDSNIGTPGAFFITNSHHQEFFLISLSLQVPGHGNVHFDCNSWVYPASKYNRARVFFSNRSYLPVYSPPALKKLREEELTNLRGECNGMVETERKEWDRVYDYDFYDDLGDPDKNLELSRPVLGGSQYFPYPRRGRTGRPRTQTEPATESRLPSGMSFDIYVPRDERFGHLKFSDFLAYSLKLLAQFLVPYFKSLFDSCATNFNSIKDIEKLYSVGIKLPNSIFNAAKNSIPLELIQEFLMLKYPLPQVIAKDAVAWREDQEFARQMLAGEDPVVIQRLQSFPPRSKLDPEMYGPQISSITALHIEKNLDGLTVERALEYNKLFILDHHDVFMPYVNRINFLSTKIYASRTLLFLKKDGTLRPVAIELSLPPSDQRPESVRKVFTPAEEGAQGALWQLAKAYVTVNDTGYHQLISHWLRTHAVMEPFVIATNRQLSVMHPVHKLLTPHFRDTMNTNALARQLLVNAGGLFETTVSPGKYSMEMSAVAYKDWRFDEQGLPADLLKRGMAMVDSSMPHGLMLMIQDYPYAVDGLEIWFAILSWVVEYLSLYYQNDDAVKSDTELQAWWGEIRNVGHGDKKDETWWYRMESVEEVEEALTTIIWIASAFHAAVNFGQYPYAGYIPNRPTITRRLIPEAESHEFSHMLENPDLFFLGTINNRFQTTLGLALVEILSRHSTDEVYLGQRATSEWSEDERVTEAFERFGKKLKEIQKQITERNQVVELKNRSGPAQIPYTLLYPNTSDLSCEGGLTGKGIPNSVSI